MQTDSHILCRYSLKESSAPFSINETSGELFNTGVLDRETIASYNLTVVAHDRNSRNSLSSSASVHVIVVDVNDNSPQLLYGPYVANIPAELAKGKSKPVRLGIVILSWWLLLSCKMYSFCFYYSGLAWLRESYALHCLFCFALCLKPLLQIKIWTEAHTLVWLIYYFLTSFFAFH